jgi:DNA ligase-1
MDLTSFTNTEKKTKSKEEIILDKEDVKVTKIDEEIYLEFKTKSAMEKYQDFLFMSPTNSKVVETDEEAQEFFNLSISEGVEGLMFKSLSSHYKPGLRTGSMAKIKETMEDIDVVILGAEHGKGKRAGYYSSFIVAVKNDNFVDESDMYLEIGKVSSGIRELVGEGHTMENLTNLLEPIKTSEEKSISRFEPKIVLQVRYQEIQKSPKYDSGYALRFPRIISLREDKPLSEINSVEDIENFII